MLDVNNIRAGYGHKVVLENVSLRVAAGEIVAIIGANGAGKSTLINAISGLLPLMSGSVSFQGRPVNQLPAHRVARLGLVQVPEGRQVFAPLTVHENLELGCESLQGRGKRSEEDLDRVFTLFPKLRERRQQKAGSLSGGEQQMLAIARALMGRPSALLLDEPSLGLAPLTTMQTFELLKVLNREQGLTMLVVEQNAHRALDLASRAYILERGSIVQEGLSIDLKNDDCVRSSYLGGS